MIAILGKQNVDYMTGKRNILKRWRVSHSSTIADHMTQAGHRIKWDHFDILATGQWKVSALSRHVYNRSLFVIFTQDDSLIWTLTRYIRVCKTGLLTKSAIDRGWKSVINSAREIIYLRYL